MSSRDSVFGSSSQAFVHLSKDSRVHLWDVASKKERKSYVDKNHLTHSFSSYAWKSTGKDQTGGIFAAGYSDGLVGIWDLNRGVQSQIIGKANESEVPTDIVFSNDAKSIFVSSNENQIVQYDVATGKEITSIKTGKKGNLKLAMNPKLDVIAAASSSIKIIDVASGSKRKLEASFSGGISALTFTPCGRFLAAASTRTRELLVFDARATESDAPVFVLPVRGVIAGVDTKVSKNNDTIQLLAVFEDAGAVIFELDANYNKNQDNGVNLVKLELNITSAHAILAGAFGNVGNREDSGVVLAVGSKSSPVFKYIDLNSATPAVSGSSASVVQKVIALQENGLVSESTVQVNGTKTASEGTLFAPDVIGPHEMGGVKRPIVSEEGSSKKHKSSEGFIEASTNANELSLEQRLESLSSSLTRLQESTEETPATSKTLAAPTSDSLVTLIDQALQSGDDALLEQCLSCGDVAIVEATARRLPTGRIVLFLRKLVAKFEKRPSRGILLTQWLACLLRHHTAYLVTVPDLSYQLAGLSQMLEQRLSSYSKLSSLAGRLDLLMSQVNYRDAARSLQEIVPMQVFIEE